MNPVLGWLIIIFLFFAVFPLIAYCLITGVRFIYRKINNKKTISVPKFIIVFILGIICLALIPPIPFIVSGNSENVIVTADPAYLSYDDDNPNIRYIVYKGKKYQELETSVSDYEEFDYSEDADLKYGIPIANVFYQDRSFLERYMYTIFKYPVHSQLMYSVENRGMENYISLEGTSLFCLEEYIDEQIAYYSDPQNYEFYVENYNEDSFHDIKLSNKTIEELRRLTYMKYEYGYNDEDNSLLENIPEVIKLDVPSDYNEYYIRGESKDKLFLREIASLYIDENNNLYQIVGEDWQDDGSTVLYVLSVPKNIAQEVVGAFEQSSVSF